MSITVNTDVPALPEGLLERALNVDVATFGHFLETGFADIGMRRIAGTGRFGGRAVTVKAAPGDAVLVHLASGMLEPGDVLVIDTNNDQLRANCGGFVISAVVASGATGVLVDGVCTDAEALRESGVSVYARGTSVLTNKMLGLNYGGVNVPVVCGGVAVLPGMMVLGDENGFLIADPSEIERVISDAEASDAGEPAQIARMHAGEKIHRISPAAGILEKLGVNLPL